MSESVSANQRYIKSRRCPICEGCERDARGQSKRCIGYLGTGGYAYCSREEHAGSLALYKDTSCYLHKLTGPCKCGAQHGAATNDNEIAYDYRDRDGTLLYQVVRKPGKNFVQRKPDGAGGWIWKLENTPRVPYRLPELRAADRGAIVYIAEGEKDVESLCARGLVATCNPGGAGKWHLVAGEAKRELRDRHVVVLPDNDKPGLEHGADVAASLQGVAASVRIVPLPAKDVSDWFAEGHTAAELADICAAGDDEEKSATPPPVADLDPWEALLKAALADIKAKLETSDTSEREPLFEDAVDLLARKFDGAQWLIDGLFTRGGVAMIGGEPKAAIKTWSATECAIAVATGTKAFGEFFAQRGVAVYFYAEDVEVQARNRVRSLLAGAGRTLQRGRLHLRPRGIFIDVLKDDDLAWIVASVRKIGKIDLLILDPLRDIHSGEEDKSDSMRNVMRRLRVLAELLDCAVLVIHHAVKRTQDSARRKPGQNFRGSSAIHGSLDALLAIEESESNGTNAFKTRVISQVKGARSSGAFELDLAITDDAAGYAENAVWQFSRVEFKKGPAKHEQDDQAALYFVRTLADGPLSRTALKLHDSRPIPEKRFSAALDRLIDSKRLRLQNGRVCLPAEECNRNG